MLTSAWASQRRQLVAQRVGEHPQSVDLLTEDRETVRWTLGYDEALATKAHQQRHRSDTNPLRLLVRARASELEERSPQVRKLSHEGRVEPNARPQRGG